MGPNRRVWHTAQTGQDAREKWDEMVDEIWEDPTSPFREMVRGKPLRSNGKEALTFVNGSKLRPHPPTRDALHGKQSDTNNIDEAWSFDEFRGNELMQAITPTQTTRWRPPYNGAQTWVWSTAGDAQSEWFWKLVQRGRRGDPGMAYFEWSIPDGADPFDLEMIAAHHPAFGITVTMDSLNAAYTQLADKPGEFARAYGNVWTGAGERIISTADWERGRTVEDVPDGPPAFGVAVAHDGSPRPRWSPPSRTTPAGPGWKCSPTGLAAPGWSASCASSARTRRWASCAVGRPPASPRTWPTPASTCHRWGTPNTPRRARTCSTG
jgi:hypothetical protein